MPEEVLMLQIRTLAMVAVLALAGCTQNDTQITQRVQDRLAQEGFTNQINVDTTRRVVKLEGVVSDRTELNRAEMVARNTPGIMGVDNRLVVQNPVNVTGGSMETPPQESPAGSKTTFGGLASEVDAEASLLARDAQLLERIAFELAGALAGQREANADLLEGPLRAAVQAEPKANDLGFALGELGQERLGLDLELVLRDEVVGRGRRMIDDEVPELGGAFAARCADRRLEAHRLRDHVERTANLLHRQARTGRQLIDRRELTGLALEPILRAANALDGAGEMHREADHLALIRERAAERVTDPPGRVRAEAQPAAMVELVDRAEQPEVPLLDEIDERHPAIATRERHDDSKVRLHELGGDLVGLTSRGIDVAQHATKTRVPRLARRELGELAYHRAHGARV
jgi:hypothetical protein